MKALQIAAYGETPTLRDIGAPTPGPDEVVVALAGAATNPLDLKIAAGYMQEFFPVQFPYTLGTDISGTVIGVGTDVTGWKIGDPILARTDPTVGGAFAERAVVPAAQLVAAPTTVALPLASGAVTAAAAAWQALVEIAGVQPGQRVLIHAASGGVGSFAVQLARSLDVHVVATASGAGLRLAHDLGAHEVIDYSAGPFTTAVSDLDVVIDTVGGAVEEQSLDVLRPGGLLVAVSMPPDEERAAARGLRAAFLFHASDAARLGEVARRLDDGLRIVVDRTLALADGPQALSYLADGHAKGKVLLQP